MRPLTVLSFLSPLKVLKKEHAGLYTLSLHSREIDHMSRDLRWGPQIILVERSPEIVQPNLQLRARQTSKSNQVVQSFIYLRFQYLQGWRLNSLPGHLLQYCTSLTANPPPFAHNFSYFPLEFAFSCLMACPLAMPAKGSSHHHLPNAPQVLEDSNQNLSKSFLFQGE